MPIEHQDACALVDEALSIRQQILDEAASATGFAKALLGLRDLMRANAWTAGAVSVNLEGPLRRHDRRTRLEGFHVLHDWDGRVEKVLPDTIAVDVLHYILDKRGVEETDRTALAILLDYHFLYVLALLSLRIWDEGDADENLDRLNRVLETLQGPAGSGQQFAANAATLILIATSHFELEDARGYETLLEKVRLLNQGHRTEIALSHAAAMGAHLRFGFEATYGRDTVVMRNDNVVDYPWLSFSLANLMTEYQRLRDGGVTGAARDAIVEGLLNALSPDARAFVGDQPPASLRACADERNEFRDRFHSVRNGLLDELEQFRPARDAYSPLSFFFNFSQNVLKGTVVDALLRGEPWPLSLNDLLTGLPRGDESSQQKLQLATTLMGYARENPDRIRGRLMPVIVYDPSAGRQAFSVTMRKLRE
jgi:hypothetical protein